MIPAFGAAAPAPVPGWVLRLWAQDSGQFVEQATASITWTAMKGAVRYDVERAIEPKLGCSPRNSDESLIGAGNDPLNSGAFERVTSSAFLARFEDSLPGRAPTRALYRVRGVSAAGVSGAWLVVALVRVPGVTGCRFDHCASRGST